MEVLTLVELEQRKADLAAQLVAAEMNYTFQVKRAEDARDQWMGLQGSDKMLDVLIRSAKVRVDNKPLAADNQSGTNTQQGE